jgi:class 3 adenylate cyclase
MLEEVRRFRTGEGAQIDLRIGIHTGSAVAGVIGQRKFSFDVWGTTVNIASRMESLGEPGKVHVSEAVAQALTGKFAFAERGLIEVKGAGAMRTFFLGDTAS